MNAKKCDRCGALFEEKELFDFSDDRMRYAIIKDCHPFPDQIKLDLCPSCQKGFFKWLTIKD